MCRRRRPEILTKLPYPFSRLDQFLVIVVTVIVDIYSPGKATAAESMPVLGESEDEDYIIPSAKGTLALINSALLSFVPLIDWSRPSVSVCRRTFDSFLDGGGGDIGV